jgi:EipB-like
MRLNRSILGAACALALAVPAFTHAVPAFGQPVARAAVPTALASHKAIYELNLLEGAGTKAPASATGRIAFEFGASCEGYAQTLRQVLDIEPNEGERQVTETRSTTFEDAAGADFRFNVAGLVGKGPEVDGHAARDARGVSIALNRPEPFRLDVASDVLFPTQHIEKVIDAARRGEKVVLARVYDASDDGRKISDVTTVIGKPRQDTDPDKGAQIPALRTMMRWPVAVAYFSPNRKDGLPDYVLSFNLYENGVSTGLRLDYGDFVLSGELARIEFPPAAKCRR